MAVDTDRAGGGRRELPDPCGKRPGRDTRRAGSIRLTVGALFAALALPAEAQQTVIIGGPTVIGPGAGGLVVNNEVLESLGPSAQAPLVPVMPGAGPVQGASPALSPGIVYRQPDTGQLMVTRPGTLLFPPPRSPKSRLALGAGTTAPEPELTSRLFVPAPSMEPIPVEPVVEKPVAAAKPPPPAPALPQTETAPEPQVATRKEPEPEPKPSAAEPSQLEAPPAPSALTQELTQKTVEPAPEMPVEAPAQQAAATEPAAPATPPVAPPVAPPAEPKAAPAAPPEPQAPTASAAETEPPPPPATSLTSEPVAEPQTAALPPPSAIDDQVRVLFGEGSAELNDDAKGLLDAVATALEANPTLRIQLLAYAKAAADGASRARRLSLSRALAVRAFLIERGVRSTRMDVRALGDKIEDGPADRVDILPQAVN